MAGHGAPKTRNTRHVTGHQGNPKGSSPSKRKSTSGKKNTAHKSGRKK